MHKSLKLGQFLASTKKLITRLSNLILGWKQFKRKSIFVYNRYVKKKYTRTYSDDSNIYVNILLIKYFLNLIEKWLYWS